VVPRLEEVPYVTCPHCHVASYAPLSYRERRTRCPSCEEPLGEPMSGLGGRPIVLPNYASQDFVRGAQDGAHSAGGQPAAA
jgi:hypothetical protein